MKKKLLILAIIIGGAALVYHFKWEILMATLKGVLFS